MFVGHVLHISLQCQGEAGAHQAPLSSDFAEEDGSAGGEEGWEMLPVLPGPLLKNDQRERYREQLFPSS